MKSLKTMTALFTGALLLSAGTARAEMSQGAKDTATACAYMGGIGAAAGATFERGALKYGAIGCAGAAAAVGAYNYLVIPADAADAPKDSDLRQDEPAPEQAGE